MVVLALISRLKIKLGGYKHRSVPWLFFNWNKRLVKRISAKDNEDFDKEDVHLQIMQQLFESLNESCDTQSVVKNELGFNIRKQKSSIAGAGDGVFVISGKVEALSLVAFYPGTVYYPMEPKFFQSLGNSFILKCLDGVMIDGKDNGISKRIFRSASARDKIGSYASCDCSWLTNDLMNPLSMGQYINNATKDSLANVTYQEVDVPISFPLQLRKYIPNVHFTPRQLNDDVDKGDRFVRTVILIALRDIYAGEELFSSYLTEVVD